MAYPTEVHRARELLEQYGVGFDVTGDRSLTTAAFGDRALRVPSPNGKGQHVVWASKYQKTVEDVAKELLKRDYGRDHKPSAEEVATQLQVLRAAGGELYPDDDALMAQARLQQKLVAQASFQRMEGAERLLDLAREKADLREQLLPMMGVDPAVLNAKPAGDPAWVVEATRQQAYGAGRSAAALEHAAAMAAAQETHAAALAEAQRAAAAERVRPQSSPPATENASATTPPPGGNGPAADAANKQAANPDAVKPEVNDWWTATSPLLKDIPVLKDIPNWGYVGAGAAGASALAYHLMAAGQQQQNNAAYAAQVQAMNAY